MLNETFEIIVLFAVVSGVVASVLTVLAWSIFRHTSAKHLFAALTVFIITGTLYHVILLVVREQAIGIEEVGTIDIQVVRSVMYTAVAACVVATIYFSRQTSRLNQG